MIGLQHRRDERTGALRARLVASILVAALLPFLAAWWIANAYVSEQARSNADMRLAFTARSAAREASALLAVTRTRAIALAGDPALQRAAHRHDRRALARLLRSGEAVRLARVASGSEPQSADEAWIGERPRGVPAVLVEVTSGRRRLATVSVSAPAGAALLDRIRRVALAGTGDLLALERGGVVVAGPATLQGGILGRDGRMRAAERSYRTRTVELPGYDPPARIVAVAYGPPAGDDQGALRRRLVIAALVSLVSICLYAATLARPLLRGLNRVASVAEQAMIDPLTGTSNRRGFERALVIELERSRRHGHPCALVIADLDDFKQVNDLHGHDVGDDVLVTFAALLRDSTRPADTVARLGGEEFALLLPETGLPGALVVAERARIAFEAGGVLMHGGDRLAVTASFGAADFPASRDRVTLLREADQALYTAKRLGKNRVVTATRAVEAA
jgi:diguanylate cyclase (GGDEF)-like protein